MQEKGHIDVTYVTKHSSIMAISLGISVFILDKNHFIVSSVTRNSLRKVISVYINVFITYSYWRLTI
jgi:hypothetical protein